MKRKSQIVEEAEREVEDVAGAEAEGRGKGE